MCKVVPGGYPSRRRRVPPPDQIMAWSGRPMPRVFRPLWPAAGNPASSAVVFPAVHKGSGPTDARATSARSPLPPAAELYVEWFGWPISVENGEVKVNCGEVLDVTTMPAGFAADVDLLLRLHLLKAPIMEVRSVEPDESLRWAFFSQPRHPTRTDEQLLKLAACHVTHFGVGTTFPLPPSPTCNSEALRWRVPPPFGAVNTPLPPWESVASCVLKATYQSGRP